MEKSILEVVHESAKGLLDKETRTHVDTATAAFYLNRRPQTLRVWACYEKGPIRPVRIYGRLAWPIAIIRALLKGI